VLLIVIIQTEVEGKGVWMQIYVESWSVIELNKNILSIQ